jgi:hypothetical protein
MARVNRLLIQATLPLSANMAYTLGQIVYTIEIMYIVKYLVGAQRRQRLRLAGEVS